MSVSQAGSALAVERSLRLTGMKAAPWIPQPKKGMRKRVCLAMKPTITTVLGDMLPIIGGSLLFFTLVAGLAGTLYGFLAARGPVRRLNRLAEATLAWSQGDFNVSVDDPSGDELGQLAHRLNDMARQLQHLLETRRELAVVEERNRLAREIHDTLAQGLAGLNLIHDVGYMDNGMVCSTAQLVLGNENIGMAKRFIRGIEVNHKTLARELIADLSVNPPL